MQEHFKNQKDRDTQIPYFIPDRKTRIISPKNIFSRLIDHTNVMSHKCSVIANANGFHSRLYTRSMYALFSLAVKGQDTLKLIIFIRFLVCDSYHRPNSTSRVKIASSV